MLNGFIDLTLYVSFNSFKSLASVTGSHDTYIIVFDFISFKYSFVLESNPALGGSTIIKSIFLNSFNLFSTLSHMNSIFFVLFNSLFLFAFFILDPLESIPIIFFAYSDTYIPIVPVPVYKSNTFLGFFFFTS